LYSYFEKRNERTEALMSIEKKLLTKEALNYIKSFIDLAISEWETLANNSKIDNQDLVYSGADFVNTRSNKIKTEKNLFVALDAYEDSIDSKIWKVPQSLRTVEPEAVIRIK
jgi:hypothetical protein